MKTATLPSIHVALNFRQEMERVFEDGETVSKFVEGAVRREVDKRKCQAKFVRRGIAAIRDTQRTGNGVPASEVLTRLETRLSAARQTLAQRGR
jgi:hypothetical protein